MGGMGISQIETQQDFRARTDSVAEADDSGWITPLNTNWVVRWEDLDTKFRLRISIEILAVDMDLDQQFELHYALNIFTSFTKITANTTGIKSVLSGFPGYDDDDTSTQMFDTATRTYQTDNQLINAGDDTTGTVNWLVADGPNQRCETEWVLQFVKADLCRGDTIEFAVRLAGGGALNAGYVHVPFVAIQAPRLEVKGKELRTKGKELRIK